jgi:hypothetical protein
MANEFNPMQAGTMSPEDYAQQQALTRQQQMAQMLLQQGTQQPQGQMVSGRYVPTSFFQNILPIANIAASQYVGSKADAEQNKLAQKLRTQEIADISKYNQLLRGTEAVPAAPEKYTQLAGPFDKENKMPLAYMEAKPAQAAVPGNADQANMFAASSYSPILRQMGIKRMTDTPDWKEGKLEQPDGSVITGWYNPKAANPLSTFIQGGTKPAYTPLEAAKYTYDTGLQPPGAVVQTAPSRPVQPGMPPQQAPVVPGQAPVQATPTAASMPNRPAAVPMSNQVGNQPITATGNTVPVSAMNRPNMSPKDLSDANKSIYTKREEQRQVDLAALPGAMEQAKTAIKTIDDMIGDARLNDKGQIVYETYDPVSKKFIKSTKEPHGGFEQYVGLGVPFLSNIHGTDTASFRTLYDSLKGQAFLEAFQRLKGAGQITEIEGQKATDALLKLNNAQSEKDFVKYSREFQENLQKGMDLAKNKAGVSKDYKSPVGNPALRWNPQTNSWVNQ